MKKNHLLIIFLLAFSLKGFSQRAATQTVQFSSDIKKIIVDSQKGLTFLKEKTKISAYSNDNDKIIWEVTEDQIGANSALNELADFDLGALGKDPDDVEIIDGTNYIFANINNRDLVIDALSGEMLFNSERDLGKAIVLKQMFLPYEDAFVFLTKTKKEMSLQFYDLKSKKVMWTVDAGKDASMSESFSKSQATREDRSESNGGKIYSLINNNLFMVDKSNGKLLWTLPGINRFFICQNGQNVVVMKNIGGMMSSKQIMNIVSVENGKNVWKDDLETVRFLSLQDWGSKILVAHAKGFNFYNFTDGSKVWKKDVKGSDFKQVLTLGNDFLYVAENEMILIDNNGKPKWKNDIEISDNKDDAVYYLDKTKSGKIMYLTSTYGNMVDYESGKKLWKRNIKFDDKRPLLFSYDEAKDIFLIYNDKDLYRFDPKIDDKPEPFGKVDAKSDKTMAGIELFDWGVSLTSQSEVIGIGNDGKPVFQKEYEQPGEGARKLMKVGGMVASSYLGGKGAIQSGIANATVTMSYVDEKGVSHTSSNYLVSESSRASLNQKAAGNAAAGALVSELTKNVGTRFNALKQNANFAYIFAKDNSGDANLKVLVKVNKQNGEEVDKIIVDGTKPLYDIDASTNTVYFAKGNVLSIFK